MSADNLRREGNGRFNEGNYVGAIEKYMEAVTAGGGSIDNKVKCYRYLVYHGILHILIFYYFSATSVTASTGERSSVKLWAMPLKL